MFEKIMNWINYFTFTIIINLYLLCIIKFVPHAEAITTKSLPSLIINNNTDASQFVQIRSVINQPTRTFLIQHKSALSPAQQTHILDDIQKNQRIHYQPTTGSTNNLNNRRKSLFGINLQVPPSQNSDSFSSVASIYDAPHVKFQNFDNLNSLSPPPLQTVVLSPQQSLPTLPTQTSESFASFRPITHSETTSKQSSPLFAHNNVNTLTRFEPLKIHQEHQVLHDVSPSQNAVFYQPTVTARPIAQQHYENFGTKEKGEQIFSFGRQTTPLSQHSFFPQLEPATNTTTSNTKSSYHTKDSSSLFSSLLEIPKSSSHKETSTDKIIKEIYLKTNPEILIAKDRQKFFQQILENNRNSDDAFENINSDDQTVAQNDLSSIRSQFEKKLLRQLKEGAISVPISNLEKLINSSDTVSEFNLPNGQRIQISKDYNRLLENNDSSNKIKAIVLNNFHPATITPKPDNILEELTKGVVPPGAEVEVIKRNKDGALEEIGKLPPNIPQKKVTFVILEEQPDGTVKVQGVRGSEKDSLKESGEEVDTIIRKIKEGELQLPPSTKLSFKQSSVQKPNDIIPGGKNKNNKISNIEDQNSADSKSKQRKSSVSSSDNSVRSVKRKEQLSDSKYFVPTPAEHISYTTQESIKSNTYLNSPADQESSYQFFSSPSTVFIGDNNYPGGYAVSSTPSSASSQSTIIDFNSPNNLDNESWNYGNQVTSDSSYPELSTLKSIQDNFGLFHLNNSGYIASLFSALKTPSVFSTYDTSGTPDVFKIPLLPTTLGNRVLEQNSRNISSKHTHDINLANSASSSISNISQTDKNKEVNLHKLKRDRISNTKLNKKPAKEMRKDNDEEESAVEETKTENILQMTNTTLSDVLKKEGFYAMSKFLRQSGLDSILNDTGPFTLFVPTDKAFRTLLIQLGGPDKAEEKFKENPRLLSGLLLHHVIPGAFRVSSLQDEMTGVSLAGTQLRVNTYTTHDIEWNDITVTTVNGAKISDEKDIVIPQGIAHSIDRVMFPLPVGNLLQSLQADKENRYSNFLKILDESELSYLFTGSKTFTLFAPLNRAFTHAQFTKIVSDPNESKSFILRHIVPGALYSAGMKYYQVRDSMDDGQQVTVYKEAGKIKVNSAHVVARNIPTINGVIHAIDTFL